MIENTKRNRYQRNLRCSTALPYHIYFDFLLRLLTAIPRREFTNFCDIRLVSNNGSLLIERVYSPLLERLWAVQWAFRSFERLPLHHLSYYDHHCKYKHFSSTSPFCMSLTFSIIFLQFDILVCFLCANDLYVVHISAITLWRIFEQIEFSIKATSASPNHGHLKNVDESEL